MRVLKSYLACLLIGLSFAALLQGALFVFAVSGVSGVEHITIGEVPGWIILFDDGDVGFASEDKRLAVRATPQEWQKIADLAKEFSEGNHTK